MWRNEREKYYRKQYQLELERKAVAQHFESLTKYAYDFILLKDSEGNIIEANDRALEAYGYSRSEFSELNIRDLRAPEASSSVSADLKRVHESNGLVFETVHQRKDRTRFDVEVSSRPITIAGVTFYQSIIRDITERKKTERKMLTLNSLYGMAVKVNKAIARCDDQQGLFEGVCRVAVENGKFMMASIGVVDGPAGSLRVVASQCLKREGGSEFIVSVEVDSDENALAAAFMREGHMVVCNSIAESEYPAHWRKAALKHEFRSAASFPLMVSEMVYGGLGVYSGEVGFFDDAVIKALEEMAGDLSCALEVMKKAKKGEVT